MTDKSNFIPLLWKSEKNEKIVYKKNTKNDAKKKKGKSKKRVSRPLKTTGIFLLHPFQMYDQRKVIKPPKAIRKRSSVSVML